MSIKKVKDKVLKFSKKIIVFCIAFIIFYTIVQLLISYQLGMELSPTLTTCVYAFFGTELAACALIRIFDKDKNPQEDEPYHFPLETSDSLYEDTDSDSLG